MVAVLLTGVQSEGLHGTSLLLVFQDISSVYQIFADEVLGSGQFGIVYGGQSGSRAPEA